MTDKLINFTVRGLSPDLHAKFKAACAIERISLQAKIIELITAFVVDKQ